MIAYIKGILTEKEPTRVVLEAAGVGYEMLIPVSTYDRIPRIGQEVKLLAVHDVREDAETLFGFASESERDIFRKLVSVSGVGPKIAIAILSGMGVSELSLAIAGGDAKRLAAVKGIGKKTAEKICLELRDKVDAFSSREGESPVDESRRAVLRDATLALQALGFSVETAGKMLADVLAAEPNLTAVDEIIRKALSGRK